MSDSEGSEIEYEVEKIIGERKYRGKKQYKIKWVGYPEDEATWEDAAGISHLTTLIQDFNNKKRKAESQKDIRSQKKAKVEERESQEVCNSKESWYADNGQGEALPASVRVGFAHGDEVEMVDGAKMNEKKVLYLLVKWNRMYENQPMFTFIPAWMCHVRCPQLVIDYYEANLRFDAEEPTQNS
eukprot:GCRY01001840.1.p1 GENE.GCRY01001840.1~~GCRY01001840.1.p1  ORF type:complete len:184 (+),score=18.75 GCRY01001840.1:70-621(+)